MLVAGRRKDYSMLLENLSSQRLLEVLDDSIVPHQFNVQEKLDIIHEHHRDRRSACDDRYLLFMLDTSSSIGIGNFSGIVNSLSRLVSMFCSNTKVAAVTFGSHVYHEFCFNCYNNHITISKAMKSIPYHGGSTHTGTAIKCACEEMLSIPCGLPTRNEYQRCPAPIDVIIITDGKSNGPLDVCKEAKCLHQQPFYDINTFTIGVNHADVKELNCMLDQNKLNANHLFDMRDSNELQQFLQNVVQYLTTPNPQHPYGYPACFDVNRGFEN